MIAPWGRYTKDSRGRVLSWPVRAGTMQSRNGRPRVAPAARKKVRLDRCFFVINMTENWAEFTTKKFVEGLADSSLKPLVFKVGLLDHLNSFDIEFNHFWVHQKVYKRRVG